MPTASIRTRSTAYRISNLQIPSWSLALLKYFRLHRFPRRFDVTPRPFPDLRHGRSQSPPIQPIGHPSNRKSDPRHHELGPTNLPPALLGTFAEMSRHLGKLLCPIPKRVRVSGLSPRYNCINRAPHLFGLQVCCCDSCTQCFYPLTLVSFDCGKLGFSIHGSAGDLRVRTVVVSRGLGVALAAGGENFGAMMRRNRLEGCASLECLRLTFCCLVNVAVWSHSPDGLGCRPSWQRQPGNFLLNLDRLGESRPALNKMWSLAR